MSNPTKAPTLADQVSVEEIAPGQYASKFNPERLGNTMNIGYGGCTIGAAVKAAYHTVSPQYRLYSATGTYLGPALTDRRLLYRVTAIRDTRTFATRQIEVSQEQEGGSVRPCLIMLADFMVKEEVSMFTYSTPPTHKYTPAEQCTSTREAGMKLVEKNVITPKMVELREAIFELVSRFFDSRLVPEGVSAQNWQGMAKAPTTTQDHLKITEKTSADWFRSRHSLQNQGDHLAGLSFMMDGGLPFLPLTHSNLFLNDAGACSSLDFALRIFVSEVQLQNWHLRENKTVTAGEGRTYSEARMWDENGTMVANMTQQCILRPKPAQSKKSNL